MARLLCRRAMSLATRSNLTGTKAQADLDGERIKLKVSSMRSMASRAANHRAYLRATQQAFLEAHELAFHCSAACFANSATITLTSAAKKILLGYEREMTTRFITFRSPWLYEASFCTSGEGHEKGRRGRRSGLLSP